MSASGSSGRARKPGNARTATPSAISQSRTRSERRASRAAARQLRTRDATSSASRASGSSGSAGGRAPTAGKADGLSGLTEQLVNRILRPLGLVVLSRERISETLHEAAAHGRLTRSDAEVLVMELVHRGHLQTEELLGDLDRTLGRGRQQLDVATRRARKAAPDRLVRGADRARRTIGVGPSFPILGYDDLNVTQIKSRLSHLTDPELRAVRDYERRHANRKSLLNAIEKALG